MSTKINPFVPDSYLTENSMKYKQPYRARNILSRNNYTQTLSTQEAPTAPAPQPETPVEQPSRPNAEPPTNEIPAQPAERTTAPEETPVGHISVGVFTASGALPVKDAVVTVYQLDEEGEENVLYHVVSDASGQVPLLELPAAYNRFNPLESSDYFFSTYNLRVQAVNYYTYNLLDFRVFPNTTTSFMVELIPVAAGPGGTRPDTTYVIPPSSIDISNE